MAKENDPPGGAGWSASVSVRVPARPVAAPGRSAADLRAMLEEAVGHHQNGRLLQAEQLYRQILAIDPNNIHSLDLLGVMALSAGHPQDAVKLISRAIMIDDRYPRFHMDLAAALKMLGRLEEAEQSCRRMIQMEPGAAGAYSNLGAILQDMGRLEEAEAIYRQALTLRPDLPEAHNNLGAVLQDQNRFNEAEQSFQRAMALNPDSGAAHANLGLVFHALGRLDAALVHYDRALELKPGQTDIASSRLLCMTYSAEISAERLLAEHRDWDRRHGEMGRSLAVAGFANTREPERRLRVGYVSADLRTHPVGYFILNVLEAHDRSAVDSVCYSHTPVLDETSERLRAAAGQWRNLIGVSDVDAASMIRGDRIDILIDVSGHTANNRLLLLTQKPAPIQASWLGYPGTTGLSAIDYLLMDAAAVPPGAERWCSEAVVRLAHSRFCYAPPAYAPEPSPPPSRGGAPIVFGSFNNITKLGPQVVKLWARVLQATPGSRLVLKWKSITEPATRDRLIAAFVEAGVEAGRLDLREVSPHAQMLAEYGDIDVALDPFPFCGGLTSCEAMWMGVPVVTLPGDRPASRQTLGFLGVIGLDELAAASEDDYVRIAAGLAADPARLERLRGDLRPRMAASPLCDGALFTRGLEAALRTLWRRWCADQPATAFDVPAEG